MSKSHGRIELAANILIIVVSLLLAAIVVQKHFFTASPATSDRQRQIAPEIGTKVNLPDVAWSQQPKTLILALQAGCRFCNESAPFYKRVIESVKGKNIKLVAVFPTTVEESTAHLNKLGIANIDVRQSTLNNLQVRGTPTLILTNEKGEITNFWVGKLPPDKEAEVIDKLNS